MSAGYTSGAMAAAASALRLRGEYTSTPSQHSVQIADVAGSINRETGRWGAIKSGDGENVSLEGCHRAIINPQPRPRPSF